MKEVDKITSLYALYPESNTGVIISFSSDDLENFLAPIMTSIGFRKISEEKWEETVASRTKSLSVDEANHKVARQINYSLSSSPNNSGKEAILKQPQHYIYVYQSVGAMVYSPFAKDWNLSLVNNRERVDEKVYNQHLRILISRYVALALANKKTIGFYGMRVKDGIVVMNAQQADGEFILLDIEKRVVLSNDGVTKFSNPFNIIKLDEILFDEPRGMRSEELLSFLMSKSIYFSHSIVSNNVRNLTTKLVSIARGRVYPRSYFIKEQVNEIDSDPAH